MTKICCLILLKEKIIPLPQPFIAKKQNFTNNDLYSLTHLFIEKHHNNTIHVRSLFAMAQTGSKKAKRPIYSTARCTLKKKRRKKKNGLYRVNYWLLLKFYGPP